MIATDLVSRGLDTENVNLIINYDFPADCEVYSGRMGRAVRSEKGIVLNFVSKDEKIENNEEVILKEIR